MTRNKKPINEDILVSQVRLVSDDDWIIWEMTIAEARDMASERWLDLMQMSDGPGLATVKLLDYGKFLYREKKNKQKAKQNSKSPDLKTIKITYKIWEHDLQIRRKQAERFAWQNHNLKILLVLRGRENHFTSLAMNKMKEFIDDISDIYKLDWKIMQAWNRFTANLSPIK